MNYNWKRVLLYGVMVVAVCGLIYYFFFAENGSYNYNTQSTVKDNQDLMSASANLDAINVDEIDAELQENDTDASEF